ncbi:Gis3p LALA0_S07e05908g [Lachancea lanzarotensis]|uniref:LALA0S07e05908g1_1 n=1 Tax=Lachancea lanzarotensis TaxID=1245769 RepID=A0A0C7MZL2_9SACH|nr:uncharacterized protein LALA0_S07e05908g [Lachancea lanzarotensis]CEP63252.1 LALA0S07e05908g1_1 [Lachancea lanzarotensis]
MALSAYELRGVRLKRQFDEPTDGGGYARLKSRTRRAGQTMYISKSGSSVTPSMSSVLAQLKSQRELSSTSWSSDQCYSTATLSLDSQCELDGCRLDSVGTPGSASTRSSASSSTSSKSSNSSNSCLTTSTNNHPLISSEQNGNSSSSSSSNTVATRTKVAPRLKLINPQDVDLADCYISAELLQVRYKPVYQRPKQSRHRSQPGPSRRPSVELTIDPHTNVGIAQYLDNRHKPTFPLYDSNVVELENWPKANHKNHQDKETPTRLDVACHETSSSVPNRRVRQQTLNHNFLKLYAMETTAKTHNLIPDLNVDEQVLRRLSYRDIWNLEIPKSSQAHGVSVRDIKLALITRKKLWSDMMCEPRQDLHGDHAPWNMKFVVVEPSTGPQKVSESASSSLVRVNSDIKPWIGPSSNRMLRPSGKLQLFARTKPNQPLREIQYVVKGWCDARFQT